MPVSEPLRSSQAVQAKLTSWPSAGFLSHHKGDVARTHISVLGYPVGAHSDPGIVFQKQVWDKSRRGRKTQGATYTNRKLEPLQRPNTTEIIKQIMRRCEGRILCVRRMASLCSEPKKQAQWNPRNRHNATHGVARRDSEGDQRRNGKVSALTT